MVLLKKHFLVYYNIMNAARQETKVGVSSIINFPDAFCIVFIQSREVQPSIHTVDRHTSYSHTIVTETKIAWDHISCANKPPTYS